MATAPQAIRVEQLEFGYEPSKPILRRLDFACPSSCFTCMLGPNGSGKTTFLRCLLGQLPATKGHILLNDKDIKTYHTKERARLLAYVPQTPTAAFSFSVQDLVLMGRFAHTGALGLASQQDLAVAHEAMKMTETLDFASRTLDELSGGEAQCVMIARALTQQPSIMLLDEPTSHLDVRNQLKIYRMMQRLAHDWQMTVICVSHDINLAARFADRLVLLRQGEIVTQGAPEQVLSEKHLQETYDVGIKLIQTDDERLPIIWAY